MTNIPANYDAPSLQRVFGTVQNENLARCVDAERCHAIRIVRVEERQWYCTAGTKQRHTVDVTDVADIRHGAYDHAFSTLSNVIVLYFSLHTPPFLT